MRSVKIGIIGCGVIGQRHLTAATDGPGIEVVALADLNPELARESAARCGVGTVYREGLDLLEDDRLEGVVLAMPAVARTALALQAFAQGKHVLTEKPVAMNATEVEQLIAARGALVAGCCSGRYRFYPSAGVLTEFIASGALGRLRVIRCRAIKPGSGPPQSHRLSGV